jgi:Ca-activated chloride channel homolog
MSFASPLVLLALLAIPLLINLYLHQQRGRARAAATFVAPKLSPSVAPNSPRWRRHVPIAAFGLALVVLIVAAARPQRSVAVPVNNAAVVLANDVSSSMAATDLSPSRLVAAEKAANHFVRSVPSNARVGLLQFNEKATILQSPTSDHSLVRSALSGLHAGGHTAIGDGINTALRMLSSLPSQGGKRPPAAIVLLSDGFSTNGADPLAAARQARSQHVPVYTVVIGTQRGTIKVPSRSGTKSQAVPAEPGQLEQIAKASGGQAFTASDAGRLNAVYAHLAAQLGHKHVKREVTASFAGGGLVLLLLGGVASLIWFRRLV